MDHVGNFEDIAVGGCVYLYSGLHSGAVAAASSPKKDRGILVQSFVTDSTPSGLVRAYNHKGMWKLRFLQFRLCSEGAQLTVYRPPRRMRSYTSPVTAIDDIEGRWEQDTHFAAESMKTKGLGSLKVNVTLSEAPIVVRKLHLTTDIGGVQRKDPNFSLKCLNGIRATAQKLMLPFVMQVTLERIGLLEFCGRDAEHLETWLERVTMVSIVHRTFHQTLRTLRNVAQYPAIQDTMGEFLVSVVQRNPAAATATSSGAAAMDALLSVQQNEIGFAIWLIADAGGGVRRYFRVAFDEAPLLQPECAILSAVELTPEEHDRCLLTTGSGEGGEDIRQMFQDKHMSLRIRIERPSLASLGRMFYFNKWCSFVSTFCRHYEGTVEDRLLHLPSASSFSFASRRGSRQTSSSAHGGAIADGGGDHDDVSDDGKAPNLGDSHQVTLAECVDLESVDNESGERHLSDEEYQQMMSPEDANGSPRRQSADWRRTSSANRSMSTGRADGAASRADGAAASASSKGSHVWRTSVHQLSPSASNATSRPHNVSPGSPPLSTASSHRQATPPPLASRVSSGSGGGSVGSGGGGKQPHRPQAARVVAGIEDWAIASRRGSEVHLDAAAASPPSSLRVRSLDRGLSTAATPLPPAVVDRVLQRVAADEAVCCAVPVLLVKRDYLSVMAHVMDFRSRFPVDPRRVAEASCQHGGTIDGASQLD